MKIERREFLKMGAVGMLGAGAMMLLPRMAAMVLIMEREGLCSY